MSSYREDDTRLAGISETVSRSLAARVSRRSFFGRLGSGAVALSLGSAGATLLSQQDAIAHSTCGCGLCTAAPSNDCCSGRDSIGCGNLPGWNQNSCPTNSSLCGCWVISVATSTCSSGLREWCDCCGGCGTPTDCHCYTADDGQFSPSCCRHKFYTGGTGDSCSHIKCRRNRCVNDVHGGVTC